MSVDINQFAYCLYGIRPYLETPTRIDGYLYATNGHLMVRVKDDGRELPETVFNPAKAWPSEWPAEWFRITNDIPESEKYDCEWCGGNGISENAQCEECSGRGFFRETKSVALLDGVVSNNYLHQLNSLPGAAWGVVPMKNEKGHIFCARGDEWEAVLMPLRWDDSPADMVAEVAKVKP